MQIPFCKMHGLGNDFVLLSRLEGDHVPLSSDQIRLLGDRRRGVGCDQILVMVPAMVNQADFFMEIYNADGTEAGACGNGTRCAAHKWMQDHGRDRCVIDTVGGLKFCQMAGPDRVMVDMGEPSLEWQDIPLAWEQDTLELDVDYGACRAPVAVGMGNPHCVFFVDNFEDISLEKLGPLAENLDVYPEKTNVEFAQVLAPDKIRMRVWERGTGVTEACGSGACATLVAAVRRGLSDRKAELLLDGGSLDIEWRKEDGHVLMTGPVAYVFEGSL